MNISILAMQAILCIEDLLHLQHLLEVRLNYHMQ